MSPAWGHKNPLSSNRSSMQSRPSDLVSHITSIHSAMMSFSPNRKYLIPEHVDRPWLRGSDMPVCPLKFALDTERKVKRAQHETFMKGFYTTSGSAFHELIQRWFGVAGIMYGKWRCRECRTLYPKNSTESDNEGVLGPVICNCRKIPVYCDYAEFNPTKLPKTAGFRGHVDGIAFIDNKYVVLEFKTCSKAKIKIRKSGPDPKHVVQATAYRYVMPGFLDIPENQWWDSVLIIYYDRADPRNNAVLEVPYDYRKFENEVKKVLRVKKDLKYRRYKNICGICVKQNDEPYCQYNAMCFSPSRDALINEILPGYSEAKKGKTNEH